MKKATPDMTSMQCIELLPARKADQDRTDYEYFGLDFPMDCGHGVGHDSHPDGYPEAHPDGHEPIQIRDAADKQGCAGQAWLLGLCIGVFAFLAMWGVAKAAIAGLFN